VQAGVAARTQSSRQMFDSAIAAFVAAQVVARGDLVPGATVAGPAILTEDETTIIIPSSRHALCQPDGCIDITVKGA